MTLCEHGVDFLELTAYCDDCILPDGKELLSEKLLITTGNDDNAMLCHFAQLWGSQMNAKTDKPLPLGWCSWYFYFDKITENDMIANADYILANRNDYPLNLLQLDDGYQSACGDWLQTNEKFPHGLKWLADEIKRRGLTAGLWLAPFFAGQNSELYKNHPDWVVKNAQGEPIKTLDWRDGDLYALDGTHPEVQKHLSNLFRTIREIGFDYVKLDFMISACNMPNGKYYDSTATRAQALRRGLQAIREGYILGCTVPFGPTIGLVDGNRISTDITPYWTMPQETNSEAPTVPNVCRNNINHTYMHRRLWINDPDTLIAIDEVGFLESEAYLFQEKRVKTLVRCSKSGRRFAYAQRFIADS